MKISIDVDEYESTELTDADKELCEANITHMEVSANVSHNFQSIKYGIGGDVPADMPPVRFAKYLIKNVNYHRQVLLKHMEKEQNAR